VWTPCRTTSASAAPNRAVAGSTPIPTTKCGGYRQGIAPTLVLCYHGISPTWSEAVAPEQLRAQLEMLLARGYRAVPFSQAVLSPPGRAFAVTFDDGYRSVAEHALPVIERLNVPATVFVPTGFVSDDVAAWPGTDHWLTTPYADELAPMSWAELGVLVEHGWEIGSHSRTHARLPQLDNAKLKEELNASRGELEDRLGRPCTTLAYPYGEADERVVAAAAAAGYRAACTLTARFEAAHPLAWPRVGVYRRDGPAVFRAKTSPTMRQLRTTRAWGVMHPERWRRLPAETG
jgi:peptidoglycan/xylan/chitin deacetylase (PgdA/CDA1 family)